LEYFGNEERIEEKEHHASWLELFYDLVFVVVSQLSENLSHDISFAGILKYDLP
jgi:low temperature requirement protein LtrA